MKKMPTYQLNKLKAKLLEKIIFGNYNITTENVPGYKLSMRASKEPDGSIKILLFDTTI